MVFALLWVASADARDPWHQGGGQLLSADQAFQLMPVEAHGKSLHVEWNIAPGYYLYRGQLKFEAVEPAARLKAPRLPAGVKYHDGHFGDVEIYRGGTLAVELSADQPLQKLKVSYQGCAEAGVCLPPQTRIIEVIPTQP